MKTKFIPALILPIALYVSNAQDAAPAALPSAQNAPLNANAAADSTQRENELANAKDELSAMRLRYTDTHPEVIRVKRRIAQLEKDATSGTASSAPTTAENFYTFSGPAYGGGGTANRFGARLNSVVRRAPTLAPGSIILSSALPPKEMEELAEDLNVLSFIFSRNLERMFADRATEYRLGVPITMRDHRNFEMTYIQDFGLLIKVTVPIAVVATAANEKSEPTATTADSEWEKARRALLTGESSPGAETQGQNSISQYDEQFVKDLKAQIFDALKNAANLRHVDAKQAITVALIGANSFVTIDPTTGIPTNSEPSRPTVLTIRIRKADADDAAKLPNGAEGLAKSAAIGSYLDVASAPQNVGTMGGGVTFGGYGRGYGGYGGIGQAAQPTAR